MNHELLICWMYLIDLKGVMLMGFNGWSSLCRYLERVPSTGLSTKYRKFRAVLKRLSLCKYPVSTGGVALTLLQGL